MDRKCLIPVLTLFRRIDLEQLSSSVAFTWVLQWVLKVQQLKLSANSAPHNSYSAVKFRAAYSHVSAPVQKFFKSYRHGFPAELSIYFIAIFCYSLKDRIINFRCISYVKIIKWGRTNNSHEQVIYNKDFIPINGRNLILIFKNQFLHVETNIKNFEDGKIFSMSLR